MALPIPSSSSTSMLFARCCRVSYAVPSTSSSAVLAAHLSTTKKSSPRPARAVRVKVGSQHKTTAGTDAKPAASGRPKRYKTTYGIPPLRRELLDGSLKRTEYERAQLPDLEEIWRHQDTVASDVVKDSDREKARTKLEELRRNQPKRHPLWAFFHEKTKDEQDELVRNAKDITQPGLYSLAVALERPDASLAKSGRSWHVDELRRKSFEDLHTLWYKLLVERNVLYTQKDEAKRCNVDYSSYTYLQEQIHRVRKSMARIKATLSERRHAIAEVQQIIASQQQQTQEPLNPKAAGSPSEPLAVEQEVSQLQAARA